MRICCLISTFYPFVGGGETHARLLCAEMKRQGHDIFVITRRTSPDLKKEDTVDGVDLYRVPPHGLKRFGKYLMLLPVFFKLIAMRKKYDLVLVSGLRYLSIPALLVSGMFGKKCVLRGASCGELSGAFIWDSPHLEGKTLSRKFFKVLVSFRNRLLLKADGFLGISEAIREEYLECKVPERKIAVINNGTDTEKFKPVDGGREDLRSKLNLPDKTIFAYSGKLNKGKGLEHLVRVWKRVASGHDNVHLLLIGSGKNSFLSCEEQLREYVSQNDLGASVTFTGYVENVYEYLQASDLFVFPSENESLSNALIEALACGLPCLASNVGGIPDTVKDGFNGLLLPVRDEDAWCEAIEKVLQDIDLVSKWRRQGRERVLERNSMESVTRRHIEFFEAV